MFSKKIEAVRRFVNVTSEIDAINRREEARSARSVAAWTIGIYALGLGGLALYGYLKEQKELTRGLRSRVAKLENLPLVREEEEREARADRMAKVAAAAQEYEELRLRYNDDGTLKKVEEV